jgi:hypothetical protein
MQNIRRGETEERRKGLKGGYEERRKGRMRKERKEKRRKAGKLERNIQCNSQIRWKTVYKLHTLYLLLLGHVFENILFYISKRIIYCTIRVKLHGGYAMRTYMYMLLSISVVWPFLAL